jgi:hypothetical protein
MSKEEKLQSCIKFAAAPVACGHVWKDETSYSRGRERIPTVFSTGNSHLQITIVFGHIHYPETWIMNCAALGITQKELIASSAHDAADEAIVKCKVMAKKLYHFFNNLP